MLTPNPNGYPNPNPMLWLTLSFSHYLLITPEEWIRFDHYLLITPEEWSGFDHYLLTSVIDIENRLKLSIKLKMNLEWFNFSSLLVILTWREVR